MAQQTQVWDFLEGDDFLPEDLYPKDPSQKEGEIEKEEPELEDDEIEDVENSPLKIIAKDFTKNGLVDFPDDWDGDEESFKTTIIEQLKEKALNEYDLNNPLVKNFLTYVSNGGEPSHFIEQVAEPDYEKAEASVVVKAYLKATTKYSDTKIDKIIERSEDLGELDEEAEDARTWFKETKESKLKAIVAEQEKERVEREQYSKIDLEERKKLVKSSKELLGVNIQNNDDFYKFMFEPTQIIQINGEKLKATAFQAKLVERRNDPVKRREYETLLAYLEFTNFNQTRKQNDSLDKRVSSLTNALKGSKQKSSNRYTLIDEN